MNVRRGLRRFTAAAGTVLLLVVSDATSARAAASGPCDIYASGGTPCVAAHSTTRALYGAYDGPLYQVRRASDNATQDIGVLSTGGNADAAAQDAFGADKQWGYGAGAGPWIMADLEWGLFSGVTTGPSAAPTPSRAA